MKGPRRDRLGRRDQYERCLIPCANYDEFWLRYEQWLYAFHSIQLHDRNSLQVQLTARDETFRWCAAEEE